MAFIGKYAFFPIRNQAQGLVLKAAQRFATFFSAVKKSHEIRRCELKSKVNLCSHFLAQLYVEPSLHSLIFARGIVTNFLRVRGRKLLI